MHKPSGLYVLKAYLNYYMLSKVSSYQISHLFTNSLFLSPQNKKLLDFPQVTVSMRIESSRHCSTLTKIADINIQL